MKTKLLSSVTTHLVQLAAALVVQLLAVDVALSASCDVKNNAPPFISHDLTANISTSPSFCELCGYGYVTIIISNPYSGAMMTNITVMEDLGTSGLTYDPTAPTPIRYSINGATAVIGTAPAISGGGSVLTWTPAKIPALSSLTSTPGQGNNPQTIAITFAVRRVTDPEGLVNANRTIQATLSFNTDSGCGDSPQSATDILPLREPIPGVTKTGWNYDANQREGSRSNPVYGNNNDDIVWRIDVNNAGRAGLQDLRFNDIMQANNLVINYACPTAASANSIAANDGSLLGGSACVAASNNINNFIVTDPFGDMATSWDGYEVDVVAGGTASIYLVGKITADGSCVSRKTNTVSGIQWGCGAQPPAGGITATSTGITPGTAVATLYTWYGERAPLTVRRAITGINTRQPVGSKGLVTITITNNSGGTVKNIKLTNLLPPEYVIDPTYWAGGFVKTLQVRGATFGVNTIQPAYGGYPGMIDQITWTNPAPDTLTSPDPAVPLSNTQPIFTLTSTTANPNNSDQVNMLRERDVLTVTFPIVLIKSSSYDKVANLDVRTEAPNSDPPGTDPTNQTTLTNTLTVEFDTFCASQGDQTLMFTDNRSAFPEDLDVDIFGSELIFILTADPNQPLPLTVSVTNNGGHDARNPNDTSEYHTFVSFGQSMIVSSAPPSCSLMTNPPSFPLWTLPLPIPNTATIYDCTGGRIAPGATVNYTFQVIKNPDPNAADDLTFRADTVGQIRLWDGTPLWFPIPTPRPDGITDPANNYTLDGIRARVIGFNLLKSEYGTCTENNPPPSLPDRLVQIGEDCTFHIDTGGWFGFKTPGFTYIAVQKIQVIDQVPAGQGFLSSTDPYANIDPYGSTTSAVKSISLNKGTSLGPPSPQPLDEGWFNWTFNQAVPAERITIKDEWFRVNVVNRILNDPINVSAAPNQHAAQSRNVLSSNFQAVFFNPTTNSEELYDLGPNTVGYPREEVRRVDLTIQEPNLSIVKEVCNESLYGMGPGCSTFVPLADDGDAYNSYIYRLTLTNEASSNGVPHAPAYDVLTTDILDPSDLGYVAPFDMDGLDNDGDGLSDTADVDGEGAITTDNLVKNGVPATIQFSHTHSIPLLRIDAGKSVTLYYRVDYDDSAAPLQQFVNKATATYDSLEGLNGQQGAPQQPKGEKGGARVYQTEESSATVKIIPVLTQPKKITAMSNTPLSGASPQAVSIGEEIQYELTTSIPVAQLRNFVIRDELPVGVRCIEAPVINLNAPPYSDAGFVPGGTITATCTDNLVQWNFGDQQVTMGTINNRYEFKIYFLARVENTTQTNDGEVIRNGGSATPVTASYIDETGQQVVLTYGEAAVIVREPRITLTKVFSVANADAGDLVTVTVTATNSGTATAYNLRVLEDLQAVKNLIYVAGSPGGPDLPDGVDITTLGANRPIFYWDLSKPKYGIPPGEARNFTFKVRIDTPAQPLEILNNTLQASWQSLLSQATALNSTGRIGADGGAMGLRNGTVPNVGDAINDYETSASASLSVPAVQITKTDLSASLVPAIGAMKQFQIEVLLPEGRTENLAATDNLAATGLSYVLGNNPVYDITYEFLGITSINGQVPGEAAFLSFPADNTSGNAIWNMGTVVTNTEDDEISNTLNPVIRITYYSRINNDVQIQTGGTLQNTLTVNYTDGATGSTQTLTASTSPVTVVEPDLTATKVFSNATPGKGAGNTIAGGDILQYVVTIVNSGNSTAHDVNVVDTLPPALAFYSGFNPTAVIDLIPVGGFGATPGGTPNGPFVWGRDNGDNSLNIPAGGTLVLTYQAQVFESADVTFSNLVWIDWTSLDEASDYERTGVGCPNITAPNDYCYGPVSVTSTTAPDNNSLSKTIVADTYVAGSSTAIDKIVRIGDTATYHLTLNLGEGTTRNVTVQDVLPAGMAYDSLVNITPAPGSSTFTYNIVSQPAGGTTGTLTWDLGDVVNAPSNDGTSVDPLVIEYKAKVLRDSGIPQTATTTLTNTATLSYQDARGLPVVDPPRLVATDTLTLWQPVLSVVKTATPAGGDNVIEAGEAITYTIDIINSGTGPAYDMVLVDTLPMGIRQSGVITTSMSLVTAGTALPLLAPAYDANSGVATWNLHNGTPDTYTIPAGETLRMIYQVMTDDNLGAGLNLTNAAIATLYYSFDNEAVPTGGSVNDRQVYGPTESATTTLTSLTPGPLLKENTQPTATIGEQFTYRITVPAAPVNTMLFDVRILDNLGTSAADLRFVSVTKVSGSGSWTPVNTGTGTALIIEDPVNGIDIPAGEQAVVEVTVELLNTPTNVVGLNFTNTADYTFNQFNDTPASQTNGLPGTTAPMEIVGLVAQKTVSLVVDNNSNGLVDPGDVLLYTIAINNPYPTPLTGVILNDDVPDNTFYVADSVTLNGNPLGGPDGGIPPLASGLAINSVGSVSGTIAPRSNAMVTFRVQVDAGVPRGTVISNQGYVTSNELPTQPTDADGDETNGFQPTTIVVGSAQQVRITKEVFVVGGGPALAGGELEYLVHVTNTGTTPTTQLVITDDLTSLAGQAIYVAGSATLNGATAGVTYAAPFVTGDYATTYGNLLPGETATLRFRVLIDNGLIAGTRLTNTAQMAWNTPILTATASVFIDIGGVNGIAMLGGRVWHDANLNKFYGENEVKLSGWSVALYRNNELVASITTNTEGLYSFSHLEPTLTNADLYELRFTAPGAGPNTASMSQGVSPFTNGPQRISDIIAPSSSNLQNLNLPLWPNGTVYNSVTRTAVAGSRVTMLNATTGTAVASQCFDDPLQQNQVTSLNGFYKFDLNFTDGSCPAGGGYLIDVTPPATGYQNTPSQIIPPATDANTAPFSVPACPLSPADAVPATPQYCEVVASAAVPPPSVLPRTAGTLYHLHFLFSDGNMPGESQIFNNLIPIDPVLNGAVAITKTSSLLNVTRGSLVPYTITVTNVFGVPLYDISIVDRFPAGFKYKAASARLDSNPAEPLINGRELIWNNLGLQVNQSYTIRFLLVVGSGVSEGEYVNRAMVLNTTTGGAVSGEATATVRVIPDPDFDCTDVIGKVFDDRNLNGEQDSGEKGLFGVRVVTVRGLIASTGAYGRFHMTCAAVPDENRGSNFILKLDERSLPSGYRLTTENPRVQRATRGKMMRFNFGATIHRVVRIDIADEVFEPGTSEIRIPWRPKIPQLLEELKKGPSVLRLSYLGDVESKDLVRKRLEVLKKNITEQWIQSDVGFRLTIETEIFWRRGAPLAGQ